MPSAALIFRELPRTRTTNSVYAFTRRCASGFAPDTFAQYSGELEKTLYAAMRRAPAHSREVVLKPRPDARVVLHPPTFHWNDSALNQVPLDERRPLQSRIEKICKELCISEGISGWGGNRRSAPSYEVDRTRLDENDDSYLTPSCDGGGESKEVWANGD